MFPRSSMCTDAGVRYCPLALLKAELRDSKLGALPPLQKCTAVG